MLRSKKITSVFIIYWIFLAYIVAALIWWFVALTRQSQQMAEYKIEQLQKDAPNFSEDYAAIIEIKKRKTYQYVGEGLTFLLLIIAGAIFIFRAVKNQFKRNTEQHNFMMALTHELKTPISVAALNLETLQKRTLEKEQQEKIIRNALTEVNRMNSLCNNMLITSQLDNANYILANEQVNVSAILDQTISAFVTRYPHTNFQTEIEENIQVTGDTLLIQIACSNLIDNAIKYGGKNGQVSVRAYTQQKQNIVSVADEGPGILDKEKRKIFEKYYRLGNAATKSAKGTGLGLYLVKQILAKHRGNITVTDNKPTGAIFALVFPKV